MSLQQQQQQQQQQQTETAWGKPGLFASSATSPWAVPASSMHAGSSSSGVLGSGGVPSDSNNPWGEEQLIVDGEDDEGYDKWNDATFGDEVLPPPPGLSRK